jgi:carbon starvation protein
MAQIFSKVVNGRGLDLWYHFAIMFEALFILTTLDAGTRVGRYLIQDALGQFWKPLGRTQSLGGNVLASVLIVCGWGYFLVQGVRDPLGGINSLWPLFGIANQLLAAIALCLATTVILKMQLAPNLAASPNPLSGAPSEQASSKSKSRHPALALVTFVPLLWLLTVTMTAGFQKIAHRDPHIGFLAQARLLDQAQEGLKRAVISAKAASAFQAVESAEKALRTNRILHFNNLLDATVALVLLMLTASIVTVSLREWWMLLRRRRSPMLQESSPVWLPMAEMDQQGNRSGLAGMIPLTFALLKELSLEASVERAQQRPAICQSGHQPHVEIHGSQPLKTRTQAYLEATDHRFKGVTRCC